MARDMQTQLTRLLKTAGFQLHKWCANHPHLLQDIPVANQEVKLDFLDEKDDSIKTLGLRWLPKSDQFKITIFPNATTKVTKRIVTSDLARLFDPLGIMAPVVVIAKIFLQKLWELKLDWDASLPQKLHTDWIAFRNSLSELNQIEIQRHIFGGYIPKGVQLHAFADASERAYGCAVYIRSSNREGRVIVRLLCAKSKVAPLKKLTLPRLELCAAKMASELLHCVKRSLRLENTSSFLWTDSEIVLAWINSSPAAFQTFVGNRIAAIQENSIAQQWRHVPSKQNPADLLSRGVTPEKLGSCTLWFYGPPFLHGKEEIWPAPYSKKSECAVERKQSTIALITPSVKADKKHFIDGIDHRNSFRRLQVIVGYILRFIARIKDKEFIRKLKIEHHKKNACTKGLPQPLIVSLSVAEYENALFAIIKRIQLSEYGEDIKQIARKGTIHSSSSLATLTPFLDENSILRVGGRLQAAEINYDSKHPMILPHSHELTTLLMTMYHFENKHVGPQALLTIVRQRFWPIRGKTIARSISQHCIFCVKSRPKLMTQLMGNLPATRIQPARPFVNSGVDFCGPIWVHYKIRGKRPQKAYVAVFCCFSTRAVHLEVVSDLSTDAFLGALKRFMGRRGHCRKLYCDNATNFHGANNRLEELQESIYSNAGQEKIISSCSEKGIDFNFIPPRAPHFGGLWEAAVKSAKQLLVKGTSSEALTYEELETVMIEIESILNSRPITPLSSDPTDLNVLTPGHFLIGEPLTSPVDAQAIAVKSNLIKRWQIISRLREEFWKRWSSEYLQQLQRRVKWKTQSSNALPGMLVLIKEDNLPVSKWMMGRIEEVIKGDDGYVRVADVRTPNGILRRPIHKLAPLPCEGASTNEEESKNSEAGSSSKQETQSKRPHSNQQDTSPRKRGKLSIGSALVTMLIACLVLPQVNGNTVEVTQLEPKLGIHFENLGLTRLITTDWILIAYYDLEPLWLEVDIMQNGTRALRHLCDQFTTKSMCKNVIHHLEHIEEELVYGNEILSSRSSSTRHKRGAFNIVGNAANALFGILDESYAREMSNTITNIKERQDHAATLLKKQTSIVDATINIIRKNEEEVKQRFDIMDEQITHIINRIDKQSGLDRIRQQFMSLAVQMSLITINIQRLQTTILNVLTDTNHGRISPLLLSPQQLEREVATIRNHLPTALRLPTIQNDVLELYKLMSVKSRVVENHAIFQIKIPLVNWEQFDLIRVISIPIWENNTFLTIETSTEFLITTQHRDRYYPITEGELNTCAVTLKGAHLCRQQRPVYNRGSKQCACEVDFLNNIPITKHCNFKRFEQDSVWLQLTHPNWWLFAVSHNTPLTAVCNGEATSIVLQGSGFLKIRSDCTIKEKFITIHGHDAHSSYTNVSYTMMGIVPEEIPIHKTPLVASVRKQLQPQIQDLEELQQRIKEIDTMSQLPYQVHTNSIHLFSVSYIALFAVIGTMTYIAWRIIPSKGRNPPKGPTPAPREAKPRNYILEV